MDACFGIYCVSYILCKVNELFNFALPVLIALGVLYFVWGVVQYFIGDSDEAKGKGKDRIIYGIIGLAVIISVWGLVYIVTYTFGTEYFAPSNDELRNLLPSDYSDD